MSEAAKSRPGAKALEARANGGPQTNGASESWLQAQETYWTGVNALGVEICDFMEQRCQAYADAFEALPRCKSVGELLQWEVEFGQAAFKAYGDEAAKLSALMLSATHGDAATEDRAA